MALKSVKMLTSCANASKDEPAFNDTLQFETTVPVTTDTTWIDPTLVAIKDCLENDHLPSIGEQCEHCPYREAVGKVQLIHKRMQATK